MNIGEQEDYMDRYLLNEMSEKERLMFEDLLTKDESLSQAFAIYKHTVESIKEVGRDKLKSELKGWDSLPEVGEHRSTSWIWKVAAAIAGVGFFAWLFLSPSAKSPDELIAANFEAFPNALVKIERGERAMEDLRINAMILYEEANYADAIPAFKTILNADPSAEIQLYLGIAEMAIGDYKTATVTLETTPELSNLDYEEARVWYLGLCYVQMGSSEAKIVLQQVVDLNKFHKDRAEALLGEL